MERLKAQRWMRQRKEAKVEEGGQRQRWFWVMPELKADEKCDRGILARWKEKTNRKKGGNMCVREKEKE